MIEIYNNFISDNECNELLEYYDDNIEKERSTVNNVYSFKSVDIQNYNQLLLSKKLKINNPKVLRIQKIDNTFETTPNTHRHNILWTYLIFLSDNFEGGNLIIENMNIVPRKNQLIVFSGHLNHKVENVLSGERYTFICFDNKKAGINKFLI
jgi:hypothetical protein